MPTPELVDIIDVGAYGTALLAAVGGVLAIWITFKGVMIAAKLGIRKIQSTISNV